MLYHRYYILNFKNRLWDVFITLACQAEKHIQTYSFYCHSENMYTLLFLRLRSQYYKHSSLAIKIYTQKKSTQNTQMINTSLCTIGRNIFFNHGYTNVDYSYTNRGVTRTCSNRPQLRNFARRLTTSKPLDRNIPAADESERIYLHCTCILIKSYLSKVSLISLQHIDLRMFRTFKQYATNRYTQF